MRGKRKREKKEEKRRKYVCVSRRVTGEAVCVRSEEREGSREEDVCSSMLWGGKHEKGTDSNWERAEEGKK